MEMNAYLQYIIETGYVDTIAWLLAAFLFTGVISNLVDIVIKIRGPKQKNKEEKIR